MKRTIASPSAKSFGSKVVRFDRNGRVQTVLRKKWARNSIVYERNFRKVSATSFAKAPIGVASVV